MSGLAVETDRKVVFKKMLYRHMDVNGMEGYGHLQAKDNTPSWHYVCHNHYGLKGMFHGVLFNVPCV